MEEKRYGPPYKPWGDHTEKERKLVLTEVMGDGNSNKSAAKILGTTPGTIAGFRRTHDIGSKNKAVGGRAKVVHTQTPAKPPKRPESTAYDLRRRPVRREVPDELQEEPPLKLAGSDSGVSNQCQHYDADRLRCAYVSEPDSLYCRLHKKRHHR